MRSINSVLALVFLLAIPAVAPAQNQASAPNGEELYKQNCASCHDMGVGRAPNREAFRAMPAEAVLAAMETGAMITMAGGRTAEERRAIAEFLTGKSLSKPLDTNPPQSAMCRATPTARRFDPSRGPRWDGWGINNTNARFQDASSAGLTAADVPKLKLKWAFAFPGDLQSF
jgi:polyvinyl alcohol dehydrogenase (cytochrome)